jgi:hypothetical protein
MRPPAYSRIHGQHCDCTVCTPVAPPLSPEVNALICGALGGLLAVALILALRAAPFMLVHVAALIDRIA